VRVREEVSGRAPADYVIYEVGGREVVTTERAAGLRGITVASMRKDILRRKRRGLITELPKLDDRTPVYYPEDLGLPRGDPMIYYTAKIGTDRISWLTDTGSDLGRAGLLDHVASEPDLDTMTFDNAVAQVLRELPEDHDGHMDDEGIWFGGVPCPVTVAEERE
jgi:hypothetical protein